MSGDSLRATASRYAPLMRRLVPWFVLTTVAFACGSSDESSPTPSSGTEDGGVGPVGTDGGAPDVSASDAGDAQPVTDAAPDAPLPSGKYDFLGGGTSSTCAGHAGSLVCWGSNAHQVLRDGTALTRQTPVAMAALPKAYRALQFGSDVACAIFQDDTLGCWGQHNLVGDGSAANTAHPTPTAPTGVGTVRSVAMGGTSGQLVCAATTGGKLMCFGDRTGVTVPGASGGTVITTPIEVTGLSDVASVVIGDKHMCALTTTGTVSCWGANDRGQLGDGTTSPRTTPTAVPGLTGVKALASGFGHTCALTATDGVKCWGSPTRVGTATATATSPLDVDGLTSGVAELVAGGDASCARLTTGAVKCWGADGDSLGDGIRTDGVTPVTVVGLSDAVSLVAGTNHRCALKKTGDVVCWGFNYAGQLGDGNAWKTQPVDVALQSAATHITADWFSAGALTAGGVYGWGQTTNSGVLLGAADSRMEPTKLSGIDGATDVAFGYLFGCVALGGGAKCWGANFFGEVGDGTNTSRSSPTQVTGLTSGVTRVFAGAGSSACALVSGALHCWGSNALVSGMGPSAIAGAASGVADVRLGTGICVRFSSGALKCAGASPGDGNASSASLVDVSGIATGVVAVGGGFSTNCAATATEARCWGTGGQGELGNGSTTTATALTPVVVSGLAGAKAFAGGLNHVCAITNGGTVKCWGRNDLGQLGDGTVDERHTPVDVTGLTSVEELASGANFTCARVTGGGVKCWGTNEGCALGTGCTGKVPTTVPAP